MSAGGDNDSEFEQAIVANVQRHGCHINYVFSSDDVEDDEWEAPFAYSVGFIETVDQPEVIVFGLSQEIMGFMINQTLRMCRQGFKLNDGAAIDGLLEGHCVIARELNPDFITRDYLNSAMWYEKRRTGRDIDRVVQLVWPGAQDGLFPWEGGCSDSVIALQPALYERELNS